MSDGELILYQADDGGPTVQLRAEGGTVWLSQSDMGALFQTTKQTVSYHIGKIFAEGELIEAATVKEYLTVQDEGGRFVRRPTNLYSLDMILAVGYRVRGARGTQFRQWATTRLTEYLVKGFVIDDARLKGAERFDYFDELLEKIREIRASEKRFYQKVKEVYSTSVDYDGKSDRAQTFFATVQNKMLHAVTAHTAAEIVLARANPAEPNMGLTSWKGSKVRKGDVTIAKNYLTDPEIKDLNRIVTMFLDVAEDRAERRKAMTMADWETELDRFLVFNERPVLSGAGRISHSRMERIAGERFVSFDTARKASELEASEAEYDEELRAIEKVASKSRRQKT